MEEEKILKHNKDLFLCSLLLILQKIKDKEITPVSTNAERIINAFDNGTFGIEELLTIIDKAYKVLDANKQFLKTRDGNIFLLTEELNDKKVRVTIISGIDIGYIWNNIANIHDEIWKLLDALYVTSGILKNFYNSEFVKDETFQNIEKSLGDGKSIFDEFSSLFPTSSVVIQNEFNPFVGVGSNESPCSVEDMAEYIKKIDSETPTDKTMGLEKLLNLECFAEPLKRMTVDDIEKATASIKALLGDADQGTLEVLDLILQNVTDEFKKEENKQDGKNIIKVAKSVATKIGSSIDPNKIDIKKVFETTKKMAQEYKSEDGKTPFKDSALMSVLSNLVDKQMNPQAGKKKGKKATKKQYEDILKELNKTIPEEKLKEFSKLYTAPPKKR